MKILINDTRFTLPDDAKVTDALTALGAVPPFAVAVNRAFVPRSAHASHALQDDDKVEVIRPITGG